MFDELVTRLRFNKKENKLFMPNEIYIDLQNNIRKSHHIPFAFSYYYFIAWLYRYAKYGIFQLDHKQIKKLLGYSPTFPEIDYIIKKNGILDLMEYTIAVKDFPTGWTFEDESLEFMMLSDLEDDIQKLFKRDISRKYTVKFPVKGFHRYIDDVDMKEEYSHGYEDGTFFNFEYTHIIPFEVFLFSMSNKEIGCTGFYLWSHIKCQNQINDGGYDVSLDDLCEQVKMPRSTMCNYLGALRKYRMLDCYHNQKFFCLALNENERKSNTYIANGSEKFSMSPIEYEKMEVVKVDEYKKLLEQEECKFE